MGKSEPPPRHYVVPAAVIVEVVTRVEPCIDEAIIADAVASCAKRPSALRQLAWALDLDAELLTSGRAGGPLVVQTLINALIDRGAVNVRLPRCARCGAQKLLEFHDENGRRICPSCNVKRRAGRCTACGCIRPIPYRDHDGRPFCRNCFCKQFDGSADPVAMICDSVTALQADLDREMIADIVRSVAGSPPGQLRLALAIQANPAVLTGEAHKGPAQMPNLVERLIAAGARHVVSPKCTFCQEDQPLSRRRDRQRCCR